MEGNVPSQASQDLGGDFDYAELTRAAEEAESAILTEQPDQAAPSTEESEVAPAEVEAEAQTEEAPPEEIVPDEPVDNAARSKLGREVANLKRNMEVLQQQNALLAQLLAHSQAQQPQDPLQRQQPPEGEDDDFIPTTKRELAEWMQQQWLQQQQVQAASQKKYELGYRQTLDSLRAAEGDDAEWFDEAHDLCTKPNAPFNRRISGNAQSDAMANYYAAKAEILQKRLRTPKPKVNPLAGKPPKAPLGAPPTQTASVKAPQLKKLDEHAKSFARHAGFTPEQLAAWGFEA
jgi:hypothetical protein